MAKISTTYIYLGLLSVAAYAYLAMGEETPASKKSTRKPAAKQFAAKTNKSGYTEADYKARFARLDASTKNTFAPLVKRNDATLTLLPNSVATDEGNWTYGGMATVDGKATGLMQNSAKGDGVFLSLGATWKQYRVTDLTPGLITLIGPDGVLKTLTVQTETIKEPANAVAQVEPVKPPFSGPIGGQAQVGNADNSGEIPVEASQVDLGGRGGRGGGRRGRRGE